MSRLIASFVLSLRVMEEKCLQRLAKVSMAGCLTKKYVKTELKKRNFHVDTRVKLMKAKLPPLRKNGMKINARKSCDLP